MMKNALTAMLCLALGACISFPEDAEFVDTGPPLTLDLAVDAGDALFIEVPAGEVEVRGEDVASVSARLTIRCVADDAGCQRYASEARLTGSRDGRRVSVALPGKVRRDAKVAMTLLVPRDNPLHVKLKYGSLTIDGVSDNVAVEMKAGEVSVGMPRDAVERAYLAARFGDASLYMGQKMMEGRRPLLVGANVDWREGSGQHSVDVRVRYGDVSLTLD